MAVRLPISEKYPWFLWRTLKRPRKAWRAFRPRKEMPSYAWVEITNRCNLRCKSCYKRHGDTSQDKDMDLALFDRIFSEVAPHIHTLNLTGFGEFLFHRRVDEIFERLQEWPNIDLWFTTNGKLMSEEWLQKLASRRSQVIFSIDGMDAETHCYNRPGGDYEKLVFSIERSRELELAAGGPEHFPFKRHINFLVMRRNIHQIPHMVDWAKERGVTSLRFTMMNHWGCSEDFWREQNPLFYRDELAKQLNEARRRVDQRPLILIAPDVRPRPRNANTPTPPPRRAPAWLDRFKPMQATTEGFPHFEDRYCHTPFTSIYFSVDGQACACCASWYHPLGDLKNKTVREIWNNLNFRLLRVGMTVGAHTSYCRVCDLPFGLAGGNPRDAVD